MTRCIDPTRTAKPQGLVYLGASPELSRGAARRGRRNGGATPSLHRPSPSDDLSVSGEALGGAVVKQRQELQSAVAGTDPLEGRS